MKKYFFLILSALIFPLFSETSPLIKLKTQYLPVIQHMSSYDVLVKQLSSALEENDRKAAASKNQVKKNDEKSSSESEEETENAFPDVEFYAYKCVESDTLFSVSALLGLPYDTIATLNRLPDSKTELKDRILILPSVKGIFIPEKPETSVEVIMSKENPEEYKTTFRLEMNGVRFRFYSERRFTPSQRLFFLDSYFNLPVTTKVISSSFGMRNSPVYHTWKMHKGIDFACPEGSEVFSTKRGKVSAVYKSDPIFGNYIILDHGNGITSVYAHLSEVYVKSGQTVKGGEKIGLSGKTGAVTGPHLHFEIRENGNATDPSKRLKDI